MPLNLVRVSPGDLITARSFNLLLDALDALDARLTGVEGQGGAPVITDVIPAGDLVLPARVRLHGTNFVAPAVDNSVLLDGVALPLVPGSRPEELIVDIPAAGTLPRTSTLTVANRNGTGSASVHLVVLTVAPEGTLIITDITGKLGAATEGAPMPFMFTPVCTVTEDFDLELRWENVKAASLQAWKDGSTIGVPQLLKLNAQRPGFVVVTVTPPVGFSSVDLYLMLKSRNNPERLSGASSAVHIEKNRVTSWSDRRVQFTPLAPGANARPFPNDPGFTGREIPLGQVGTLNMRVFTDDPGTYRYQATLDSAGGPFTVVSVDPAGSQKPQPGGRQDVAIQVRADHPGSAQLTVSAAQMAGVFDVVNFYGDFTFPIRSS